MSRVTVRQAICNLVNQGYLQCTRGVGTVVIFEKIDEVLRQVISFSEEMRQHGIIMNTKYCEITKEKPSKGVAMNLKIEEYERCYKLVRVRCVKDNPIVYSVTYLKNHYELPLEASLFKDSLYDLLKKYYGIHIVKGEDKLEAVASNKEISKYLEIDEGLPVFKRTRKTFDERNEIIEYTVCFYPGDKHKYSVEL